MNRFPKYHSLLALRKLVPWQLMGMIIVNVGLLRSQDTLHLNPMHYSLDLTLGLAVCNSPIAELNNQGTVKIISLKGESYELLDAPTEFALGEGYRLLDKADGELLLYFTELPLIDIHTDEVIVDEPRVSAEFALRSAGGAVVVSQVGIEYKGGWTQSLEKKSFRLELWADNLGEETVKESLLGMRSDDDWNLEAMFNEPLRLRNVTNANLWRDIHSPYYLDDEPEAKSAIALEYVELFLNDEYQGVYALSERIDRKQLQLKRPDLDRRGELYKAYSWGAPTFGSLPDFDNDSQTWEGFEYVYPAENTDWSNLYNFVDFVINGWHDDFYERWDERFHRDNAIDYFIFLNAIRALDNTGKNIYIARYDVDEPYFYVPFDLDGTYGVVWNGEIDDVFSGIMSNGFYDRLLTDCNNEGFGPELKERWVALRQDLLSNESLKKRGMTNHTYLSENGIYERELLAWSSYEYNADNLNQFTSWIDKRMDYLDSYFETLCEDVSIQNTVRKQFSVADQGGGVFLLQNLTNDNAFSCKVYSSSSLLLLSANNTSTLDLSHCPAGLYFLKINQGGRQEYHKLMLRK